MSVTQPAASTSSLSPVSERPSLSMKTSYGFVRRSTNLWLPLSPFPLLIDEAQEASEKDHDKGSEPKISASPATQSLFCWDAEPENIEISDRTMKSVFEDWEDPLIPSSAVYIDKDGAQTLLITPQSAFFYPPPAPRPFGYEPFSKAFDEQDPVLSLRPQLENDDEDSESNGPILLTPKTLEHGSTSTPPKQPRGILFVDTTNNTYPSFGFSDWSATIFCSPKQDEAASWAPQGFAYGPDVPLDCIYSAGDVSPVERWDEKLWSPMLRKGLRTAPCI